MENHRIRFSIDEGSTLEHERRPRSPAVPDHEHGFGNSGLRRIRQQPPSRAPSGPSSPDESFLSPRSASMTLNMPAARNFTPGGPTSPTLHFGEDLSRFPSESLHSFSFAHQTEDTLYHRQSILRKSTDFMRDRLGYAAGHPGLVNAQAQLSGDKDVQSVMELLARAHVLGNDGGSVEGSRFLNGPLTGPAGHDIANIFDKTFLQRSESPDQISEQTVKEIIKDNGGNMGPVKKQAQHAEATVDGEKSASHQATTHTSGDDISAEQTLHSETGRNGHKRTYTDISSLSLQNKLMEALAKPYVARDLIVDNQPKSHTRMPLYARPFNPRSHAASVVHSHANRWAPAAQAIFTTECQTPWTILAANDLACLVFGVTKAEVRKLGILEVVREDQRDWLEEKLKSSGSEAKARVTAKSSRPTSRKSSASIAMSSGITAKLLSKPPSRQSTTRRAQTDDGSGSSWSKKRSSNGESNHTAKKSRGVLICGDVIPIRKRNGATGSASLWVKEKKGGLIWVLEEIAEDTAVLTLDAKGRVSDFTGPVSTLWGEDNIAVGSHVRRLIPHLPLFGNSSTANYRQVAEIPHYTVRNADGANIPAFISAEADDHILRVSSFPHIAGIIVISATTLEIKSSNTVFSAALFGRAAPDGLAIMQLIPQFDKILKVLTEEDDLALVDGIVIPEHSFRRARALLALREGSADAAEIFLRPSGLKALHRDGSSINVDVQMRVVRSQSTSTDESAVIEEASEDEDTGVNGLVSAPEVVYALWVTYSRSLHSAVHLGGPVTPFVSRPPTPPHQPSPGQKEFVSSPQHINSEDEKPKLSPTTLLKQRIEEATSEPISDEPIMHPPTNIDPPKLISKNKIPTKKKAISEFVVLEEMGQGAYGQVKLARYQKNSGKKVVLKYVTKKRILVDTWTRDRRLGTVPLEIHVLDYLRKDGFRHPNIVEMTDFFEDDVNYYIEMVPHGLPGMDLFDYIEMRTTMEEAECRNIFCQVVAALHHLHTKALVVHRDIKDENIVLDGENQVKLIDFGSAAYIKSGPFDVFVGTIGMPFRLIPSLSSLYEQQLIHPVDYAAPEVLQGKSYRGKEQDVWALGILLYTLVYKENPFYSIDEIMDHELRIPWIMSESSIDLIKGMLERDVDRRLSIGQVMEHEWCSGLER